MENQFGKIIDGIFYESLRDFEKRGGGDPETMSTRWDDAETVQRKVLNNESDFSI